MPKHEETPRPLRSDRGVGASMRPRAEARGNPVRGRRGQSGDPASMRPRAEARGNWRRRGRARRPRKGFYEASCRSTRKPSSRRSWPGPLRRCFNEASCRSTRKRPYPGASQTPSRCFNEASCRSTRKRARSGSSRPGPAPGFNEASCRSTRKPGSLRDVPLGRRRLQ